MLVQKATKSINVEKNIHTKVKGRKVEETLQWLLKGASYCEGTHPRDKDRYPAFEQTCWNCKKKNHFPKMCKQTSMNSIQDEASSDSDSDFIYAENSSSGKQ